MGREGGDAPSADSVFVVGLGRFGTAVASELVELDVDVLAIDTDQALVDEWVDHLSHVRVADGTDSSTLSQLGVTEFDAAVVAIGSGIEASILTTAALVDLGVKNVWAKAITEEHGRILQRIGAHHVVFPEREMGERVAHVVTGQVTDYFELDENFALAELAVPAALAGTRLGESGIRDRFDVTVVCIKPVGHSFTYATNQTVLGAGDVVLIAGEVEAVEKFAEYASK
ncbi:TrkA family potassium uptake protein [Acidimicrobiaceae bacterium AH-315-P05]|nr:TrkA family potassium uptake protein [Acidimicrobiaceae bacterium AH-315-P05]